jgi:hypothetical protein
MDKHDPSSPIFERLLLPDSTGRPDADSDPVARLLGHASRVEPGPFFARNILRDIRMQPAGTMERAWLWLRGPRLVLSGAVALLLALLVTVITFWSPTGPLQDAGGTGLVADSSDRAASHEAVFNPENEIEAVEYLGQLMAITDPGDLSDEALAYLFY